MTQPMVGITWSSDLVDRSSRPGENALKYATLLTQASVIPVLVTPGRSGGALARLHGLLLPGGPDIAPSRYEQAPSEHLGPVLAELDDLELEMVAEAQARQLPILGICRGQQLINVALGGTLHQHVAHPQWGEDPSAPVHEIAIVEGTQLHRTLGVAAAHVNSGHHQAVDRIASGLRMSASSADGCIEALEAEDLLITAVQWHPEEMPGAETTRRLLGGFAARVRG